MKQRNEETKKANADAIMMGRLVLMEQEQAKRLENTRQAIDELKRQKR